jgi:peptidoglycan hydrolase-like protein with peptidoglycan-binding domain
MATVRGVICHHTGGLPPGRGSMTSLKTLVHGRRDLAGPLSQLGLGRDGTYYVIAAGVANHAGPGDWRGWRSGNSNFIGIEAENSGRTDDPWPEVQMDAYARGVAALLRRIGAPADMCIAHREWAPARKVDPRFDITMDAFRARVRAMMTGAVVPRTPIPRMTTGSAVVLRTLRRSATGAQVDWLRDKLGLTPAGSFDALLEARVRAFQRTHGLVDDGIVGPKSWAALEQEFGPVPA